MKKTLLKLLTAIGLLSTASIAQAVTYQNVSTLDTDGDGFVIVNTQIQSDPKLTTYTWIANQSTNANGQCTGTDYSGTSKSLKYIDPATDETVANAATMYAVNVKSNNQKTIHAYVTGVTSVKAYSFAGGDSRYLIINATEDGKTEAAASATATEGGNSIPTTTEITGLDASKSYDVVFTAPAGDVRLYAIKFAVPTGPQMTALKATVAEKDYTATFDGKTVSIDFLGEVTGTQATSILTATPSDGASIAYYSDEDCLNAITSFTIGTAFYAKATKDTEEPSVYTINTTSQVPDATIELTSGKLSQSVKQGAAISDIVFAIANADGDAIVNGLPTGLAFNPATSTISGTVDANADIKDYNYTVTVNSKSGAVNPTASINGTITVKDKNAKEVAYIYTSTTAPSNDVYTALSAKYSVTVVDGTKALTGTAAEDADLIVLDEAVSSSATGATALGNMIGTKPILSFKAHMYGKTNWPTGTGNNDNGTDATVESVFTTHPIFKDIILVNENTITIADAIRSVSNPAAKAGTLRVIANSNGGASIVEENNGTATDAAKYMLIAISSASESELTAYGLKLVENAAEYLLGTDVFVPAASSEAVMTGFSIDGINAVINEINKTVSITLPAELYTDLKALAPEVTVSTGATVSPASGEATNFSNNPVNFKVTAEDGTTTATYAVTVFTENVAIAAPYSTTIPVDFTKPDGFIGNATIEPAYTGNDASIWYEDGETASASVLRIGKDEKLTIVVNNPGTVNIGISATGGRTFNLYVDGAATPVATASATANKKYNLTADVFLTGAHTIVIENAGNGGATIGSIEISDATKVEATLTSLKVAGVDATIKESAKTVEVEVPANADLSALAIVATTSAGASVTSGNTINATSGTATITVTSSVDPSVSSTYTVTVTQEVATGVEEAEAEVVKTYYISADGKTYNAAVKGLPLIKVEELSNGTIKTSKILVED